MLPDRTTSALIDPMRRRLDLAREESDTALFYDLMFFGELLTKLTVLGLLAAVEPTQERHRYRLEHTLVRASGIGDWVAALDDALSGPASGHLLSEASDDRRDIMKGFAEKSDSWQHDAVRSIQVVTTVIEPSRQATHGKVSLRTWYHEFTWLRNRTRGHGAIRPNTCHKVAPTLEQSLYKITDNLSLFARGWSHLRRNLSGKFRVTPLCGDQSAFQSLKSDPNADYDDGVHIAFDSEIRSIPLIETDSDLTDIFVANGGFRELSGGAARYDLLSYHTDTVSLGDAAAWLLPSQALPPSETEPAPELDVIGGSFSNLPAIIPDYVARPELERELLTALRDERHPIITLVGRGGVGKTSLALTVLHEIANAGDFFAVTWFSARDIDLLFSGPKMVAPDVLTTEAIATRFSDLMVRDWRSQPNFKPLEQFGAALTGRELPNDPVLFVFDNFETLRSPGETFAFLDQYVRLPNKVLITSRSREFRADFPISVSRMERSEFDELVNATAVRLSIDPLLGPSYIDDLYDESDGHPYVAKVLLGEVARNRQTGSIERIMADKDEILNALFERTYVSIQPAAQRAFLTLCNWRSVVPRVALEAALLRPANERMDVPAAIETLEQSSLIEVIPTEETDGEFLRVPLAAYVFGQRKLRVSPMKAAVEADTELLQAFGAAHRSEVGKGLEPRLRRMLRAVTERSQRGEDVSEDLEVLMYVARKYPQAWLLLADYYYEQGALELAISAVSCYLEVVSSDRSAWLKLAQLYLNARDGRGEVFARVEAARLPDAPLVDVSNAASALNRQIYENAPGLGDDEWRTMAQELLDLLAEHEDGCDATDLSRAAWLNMNLRRVPDAKRCVELGLRRDPSNRHCLSLASGLDVAVPES